jgi:superfamily II DNA or RNA helicase
MNLRTYQTEAVNSILRDFKDNTSLLLVMATGTGKTVVLSYCVSLAKKGRVLVIAHREELIQQLAGTLTSYGLDVGVEMAERRANVGGWSKPQVVVATIQTLVASDCRRLNELVDEADDWSLTIIDEAHHAPADSYRRLLAHMDKNQSHRTLGVTATPDRADRLAMGSVFEKVTYEYDLFQAISEGFLVPIKQQAVFVESLDFSSCRTSSGELNGKDLSKVMELERNLHAIATPTIEIASGRKSVIFCVSVAQAERLSEILNRHEAGSARCVSGTTPKDERRQMFKDFDEGKFQFLTNCMVATEGWDCPTVQLVVMARPTKSRALYAQMLGRGTRPLPGLIDDPQLVDAQDRRECIADSGKPHCEILDFAGNAGRHHLITTVDLLDGDWPDDVRQRAAEIVTESDDAMDPQEAIDQAIEEKAKQAQEAEEKAQARRAALRAKAKFNSVEMNPFDILDISPPKSNPQQGSTDKQCEFLMKFGLDAYRMSRAEASKLQREVFRRLKNNLCSIKQARILKEHGFSIDTSRDDARKILNRIIGKR